MAEADADKVRAMAKADADKVRYEAEAEAVRLTQVGQAEATKIKYLAVAEADKAARVGIAQAMAIEEQVAAYGGPKFQLTQQVMNRFSEAVEHSKVDVVPRIVVGQQEGKGSGVLETLLTMMMSDKLTNDTSFNASPRHNSPEIEAIKTQIRADLSGGVKSSNNTKPASA